MSLTWVEMCSIKMLYGRNVRKTISNSEKPAARREAILAARIRNKECDRCAEDIFLDRTMGSDYWELFCLGCGNTIEEGYV